MGMMRTITRWLREKQLRLTLGKEGYAALLARRSVINDELVEIFNRALGGRITEYRRPDPDVKY